MMEHELEVLREMKGDSDYPEHGKDKYKWVALADILEKILNNQKAIMDASGVDYAR